jgi:hypothetical protein
MEIDKTKEFIYSEYYLIKNMILKEYRKKNSLNKRLIKESIENVSDRHILNFLKTYIIKEEYRLDTNKIVKDIIYKFKNSDYYLHLIQDIEREYFKLLNDENNYVQFIDNDTKDYIIESIEYGRAHTEQETFELNNYYIDFYHRFLVLNGQPDKKSRQILKLMLMNLSATEIKDYYKEYFNFDYTVEKIKYCVQKIEYKLIHYLIYMELLDRKEEDIILTINKYSKMSKGYYGQGRLTRVPSKEECLTVLNNKRFKKEKGKVITQEELLSYLRLNYKQHFENIEHEAGSDFLYRTNIDSNNIKHNHPVQWFNRRGRYDRSIDRFFPFI